MVPGNETREPNVHDSRPPEPTAEEATTLVARFQNVAEAGYFSDVLRADGIPVRVRSENAWDSLGTPSSRFEMLVREEDAERAAARLQEHVAETTQPGDEWPDPREYDRDRRRRASSYDPPENGGSGFGAIAVVLMFLLLGAAVYAARNQRGALAGNGPARQAGGNDARVPNDDLVEAITDEPGVWRRRDADGAVHEIEVDEEGGVEHRIDADGDGRFEERTRIDAGGR